MTTVFIRGLGLIGSSLAQAIRLQDAEVRIIGSDNEQTTEYALKHQIIDEAATDLEPATRADVTILATPVSVIKQDLAQLATMSLPANVIVTDVGSTKREVLTAAQPLIDAGVTFIGGHPMAGSHKSGVSAGRPDLFENAFYLLVADHATKDAVDRLQTLLAKTRVKWLEVDANTHDRMVGQLSHVPHVIASALVNETNAEFANSPTAMRLAAGGFKSITRIASADPDMWTAILTSNADVIVDQLAAYQNHLAAISEAVTNHDVAIIHDFFNEAKQTRDALGPDKVGQLPGFHDLFLNIPDQVGALATVTKILADHEISLVNLHILEIREEVDGVLQLTFSTLAAQEAAERILAPEFEIVRRA